MKCIKMKLDMKRERLKKNTEYEKERLKRGRLLRPENSQLMSISQ
jgi:hypothetical protein